MKMIKMNACEANHENNTILCGKTFMKKASKYGTAEYNEFVGMKRDFPTYKVVVVEPKKAEGKMSLKGLTREFMEHHIITRFGEGSDEHKDFLNQMRMSNAYTNPYMYMRKWFVNKYPNWDGKENERKEIRARKAAAKVERAKASIVRIDEAIAKANQASITPLENVG